MHPLSANTGSPAILNRLVRRAHQQGPDAAAIVPVAEIQVDDHLAGLCLNPRCDMVGLGAS